MPERSEKLAKVAFVAAAGVILLAGGFLYGALAFRDNLFPVPQLRAIHTAIVVDGVFSDPARTAHLQPSRGQGSGVTVNTLPDDGATLLMTGFFEDENQIRLIARDGRVVRKWSLTYSDHFPDDGARPCAPSSPLRVDTHGVHATPEGAVVFNYEYCGTVKLDRCGGVDWTIAKPTHHTVTPAEGGGYWVLGRREWRASQFPDRFPPFSTPATDTVIQEDTLLRVTADGTVMSEVSIPELMQAGGLGALLTANGEPIRRDRVIRRELVHANKVAELPAAIAAAFPMFAAGDLAISMRELNLVMVIDPDTHAVKWHQTGPWLRQHDPEFRPDGRLSIFDNNVYRTAYPGDRLLLDTPFTTQIVAVDPASGETEVIFGGTQGQEMLSVVRGQHELLDDDGLLITEFDAGRVLQVDAGGAIVWDYVNAYDADHVGEITNAKLYPDGYFRTDWPDCP